MTLEANAPATRRILTAAIVLPMTADNPVLQNGAVLVEGDRIAAVGSRDDIKSLAPEAELLDYGQAVLLPGLINTHSHSGFLRGTAAMLSPNPVPSIKKEKLHSVFGISWPFRAYQRLLSS